MAEVEQHDVVQELGAHYVPDNFLAVWQAQEVSYILVVVQDLEVLQVLEAGGIPPQVAATKGQVEAEPQQLAVVCRTSVGKTVIMLLTQVSICKGTYFNQINITSQVNLKLSLKYLRTISHW